MVLLDDDLRRLQVVTVHASAPVTAVSCANGMLAVAAGTAVTLLVPAVHPATPAFPYRWAPAASFHTGTDVVRQVALSPSGAKRMGRRTALSKVHPRGLSPHPIRALLRGWWPRARRLGAAA